MFIRYRDVGERITVLGEENRMRMIRAHDASGALVVSLAFNGTISPSHKINLNESKYLYKLIHYVQGVYF